MTDSIRTDAPADKDAVELFRLRPPADGLFGRLGAALAPRVERWLGIDRLNQTFAHCASAQSPAEFLRRAIDHTGYHCRLGVSDLSRIPRTGPLVVVANHPFGAIEGVVLSSMLLSIRPDVKVMANFLLGRIPQLRDLFIFVDPFGGANAASVNVAPLRQSIRHLRAGGVLAVFPAGEVAHFDPRRRKITDPAWNPTVARIVRITQAPVLPVYFDGGNSALFNTAGLVHPRCRTALLARELYGRTDKQLDTRIGSPISFKRMENITQDHDLTAYLRHRVFLLRHRKPQQALTAPTPPVAPAGQEPIISPIRPSLLAAEVEALPAGQMLVQEKDYQVIHASSEQIPHLLREIGRLREITFRATGEGTGKAIDLDAFDRDYIHLFVWNTRTHEVVGGYRLGPTDRILPVKGKHGLYTHTLFSYKSQLLRQIMPALEMGRSFVRPEYQKAYQPLLLLWRGIGHYCVQHPRYRYLFGPVSISNTYNSVSKRLMIDFLKAHHTPHALAAMVHPRHPFRAGRIRGWDVEARSLFRDSDDVSDLVSELEHDQKGLPVLLRQYLKLGAKLLAFNVDHAFGDCVDGLIVVDLCKTEGRILERYMGKPGYRSFMANHQTQVPVQR
jgi:putative hemolysin